MLQRRFMPGCAHLHFYKTRAPIPFNLLLKIKQLVKDGFFDDALRLYHFLRSSSSDSINLPILYALKACGGLSAIREGQSIHALFTKAGLHRNLTSTNSLIEMYSNCTHLDDARKVFDAMHQRNSVSWNLMILGYAACGLPIEALEFCGSMKSEGISMDSVGFKIVLPICGQVRAFEIGESLHAHLVRSGEFKGVSLATAILDMYAKCGELGAAEKVFDEIAFRDVASWNAMMVGFSVARKFDLALDLLHQMLDRGLKPSVPTMLQSVQACTHLSSLRLGKPIHGHIMRSGFYIDSSIKGLLIGMYSKCGELYSACGVFRETMSGGVDVSAWSCMINGLGIHGFIKESLMLFFAMIKNGGRPDDVCFLILLSCCSHWGFTEEGWKVFWYMVSQFGIEPTTEHWGSVVDLIGRAGRICEARRFMEGMPLDCSTIGAFLGACRIHGDDEAMGKETGDWLMERGHDAAGFYKLVVGLRAEAEQWAEVNRIREMIEERKIRGNSGISLIEVGSTNI